MQHYTYRVTVEHPTDSRKFYIGVRSCDGHPLGDSQYYGSSSIFNAWRKANPHAVLMKEILAIWDTRALAIAHEIKLHEHFSVAANPMFWNRAKQTAVGFDVSGAPSPMLGKHHSEESKEKNRLAHLGRPSGMKGRKLSRQRVEFLRAINKGRPSPRKGVKVSEEVREKSMATWFRPGLVPWNKDLPILPHVAEACRRALTGRKQSPESIALRRKKMIGYVYKKLTCPHCGTEGGATAIKRWHFERCTGAKLFRARLTIGGKRVHLGRFATQEAADLVVQETRSRLHG